METREEKLRELAKEIWSVAGTPTEGRCLRIAEFVFKMLEEKVGDAEVEIANLETDLVKAERVCGSWRDQVIAANKKLDELAKENEKLREALEAACHEGMFVEKIKDKILNTLTKPVSGKDRRPPESGLLDNQSEGEDWRSGQPADGKEPMHGE